MRAHQAAVHLSVSHHVLVYVIIAHQVLGFTLLLAELPKVSVSSFLQPAKLVLDSPSGTLVSLASLLIVSSAP